MRTTARLALLAVVVSALAACGTSSGSGGMDGQVRGAAVADAVEKDLVFLREEEKLARDVYLTLRDAWGLQVFANISASEQRHMDEVLYQLDRLGVEDPVRDDAVGAFENQELAELYAELTEQGLASEVEALKVGATIEDLDIRDIREMAAHTDNASVLETYGRLECGSGNHMRAFHSRLSAGGVTYEPQFLSASELSVILATAQGGCRRGR